ncbi:MAG: ABC transporter substrate-binding protein [Chloroflexota bacterium]
MRNIRWQLLIAIGGLFLVIGLLLGQTPDLQTPSPQPAPGGVYTEALIGSPMRLNPVLDIYNQPDRDVDRLIFSGLVRFDPHGRPVPDLAESWSVSADATQYTFALRRDAVWHDGTPVTSADVIYTYSKLQYPDYPGPADLGAMWQQIQVIPLDDYTVQFQLPEPFAPFFDYLSLGLLPDHLLRGVSATDLINHPYNLQPIGTGPFRFDRFLVEDGSIRGVSLVAFPDYYGQTPYLERVEFRYFPDSQSALEAYERGEVQGISSVGPDILASALQLPDLDLHTAQLPRITLVFLNLKSTEHPFFAEKKVRQALLLAINRQWIIDHVLEGQGTLAVGPILPWSWAFASGLEPIPFNPDQAAALLDEAGYVLPTGATPGGPEYVRSHEDQTLSFELLHLDDPLHTEVAQELQTYWQAIGVQVTLRAVSAEAMLDEHLQPREFEAALADLNLSRYPDPDPYPFWHDSQAETGQNYGGYDDRNLSIWLEQARVTPDFEERANLYRSFQHRFQDQVPALLLYYPVYSYGVETAIQGVTLGPLLDPSDRFSTVTDWYLVVRRSLAGAASPTP